MIIIENTTVVFHVRYTWNNEEREATDTYRASAEHLEKYMNDFINEVKRTRPNAEILKIVKNY